MNHCFSNSSFFLFVISHSNEMTHEQFFPRIVVTDCAVHASYIHTLINI